MEIASPSDVDSELKKKGQAFCSPENLFKCLAYIADHTSSVHAIRIELRRGGRANEWELIANVVCVDGTVQRQPDIFVFSQPDSVKFLPTARAKLEQFVATLKLSELPLAPPAKAAEPPKADAPPPRSDVPFIISAPPAPPPQGASPLRMVSYVLGVAAAASLATGGAFAIAGQLDRGSLNFKDGACCIDRGQVGLAQGIDTKVNLSTGFLAAGAIVGATAITLFLLSDGPAETAIAPAPIPGGAGVVFSSRF